MNSLLRSLLKKVGVSWLTGQIRKAAEGKLGPAWSKVYWGLAGNKRVIGVVLAVVAGVAESMGYREVALALIGVGGVLVSLGVIDSNWRSQATSDALKDSTLWKILAHNSPTVTAALVAALAWLQGTTCTLGAWCSRLTLGLGVLIAVFVQLGLVDAAWNAPAPKPVDKNDDGS